jgi:hypothetical protein
MRLHDILPVRSTRAYRWAVLLNTLTPCGRPLGYSSSVMVRGATVPVVLFRLRCTCSMHECSVPATPLL